MGTFLKLFIAYGNTSINSRIFKDWKMFSRTFKDFPGPKYFSRVCKDFQDAWEPCHAWPLLWGLNILPENHGWVKRPHYFKICVTHCTSVLHMFFGHLYPCTEWQGSKLYVRQTITNLTVTTLPRLINTALTITWGKGFIYTIMWHRRKRLILLLRCAANGMGNFKNFI